MAFSQNGWQANDRALITSIDVPGGKLAVREGDVATVFTWLARRFNDEVEPLKWPGCWGYAERVIRGGVSLSNHASGTAVDFNAPQHPLGKVGTFSRTQVRAIRRILNDADGVIRWGGDYSGRKDEMHFEIHASAAVVADLARSIEEDDMAISDEDAAKIGRAVADAIMRYPVGTGSSDSPGDVESALYRTQSELMAIRNVIAEGILMGDSSVTDDPEGRAEHRANVVKLNVSRPWVKR